MKSRTPVEVDSTMHPPSSVPAGPAGLAGLAGLAGNDGVEARSEAPGAVGPLAIGTHEGAADMPADEIYAAEQLAELQELFGMFAISS